MIKPNKYMSVELNVVSISAEVIQILLCNGATKYNNVLNFVARKLGESSKYEFQNALSFLYLLNKIQYDDEKDLLELIL